MVIVHFCAPYSFKLYFKYIVPDYNSERMLKYMCTPYSLYSDLKLSRIYDIILYELYGFSVFLHIPIISLDTSW